MSISGVHLTDTFRYFLLLVRRGSELLGVSAQTDSDARFLALLYKPYEKLLGLFVVWTYLKLSGIFYS